MPDSPSTDSHRDQAGQGPVRCAVLTVSDTRTLDTDRGGQTIIDLLQAAGHEIADRALCHDEPAQIRKHLDGWLARSDVQAILTTGGTGIARRDTTIDVVESLLAIRLDGFGELFRMLSYQQVGAAAMLSRATAGLVLRDGPEPGETFVFAMPGSVNAVETAMNGLILPELRHLVWERKR